MPAGMASVHDEDLTVLAEFQYAGAAMPVFHLESCVA